MRNRVAIGGKWHSIKPITLENALKLGLLLAPYLGAIERHWTQFQRAMGDSGGNRMLLLTATLVSLRDEMQDAPGALSSAMGLLLDLPPTEVADRMTAQEFVDALPVLDKVNNLQGLYRSLRELGLLVRVGNGQ